MQLPVLCDTCDWPRDQARIQLCFRCGSAAVQHLTAFRVRCPSLLTSGRPREIGTVCGMHRDLTKAEERGCPRCGSLEWELVPASPGDRQEQPQAAYCTTIPLRDVPSILPVKPSLDEALARAGVVVTRLQPEPSA
jgi:hypothetical protein